MLIRSCLWLATCWMVVAAPLNSRELLAREPTAADMARPAFPGAEGFGATTPGGRGGKVYVVTTLEDYKPRKEQPIPGSLRAACEAQGPRIVVFNVGGLITLKDHLRITEPFLTIAGQTAPGDGICLKDYDFAVRDTHDVVVRHLRVRPGDNAHEALDAVSVYQSQNIVLDHCSASWSIDETLSVTGEGCHNVTIQWCFITESLNKSVHHKGEHGYGSLIRTDGDITYHHNLYAHHSTRCPRPGTYGQPRGILLDFRNNVIYDWVKPAGYTAEDKATLNYVGNYLKPGPSTADRNRIFNIGGSETTMFLADNVLEGASLPRADNWALVSNADRGQKADSMFAAATVTTESAAEAFTHVLESAGATLPVRDKIDQRIVEQVRGGTGRVIDSPQDVGGWPEYRSGTPRPDRDSDGLPDTWEKKYGDQAGEAGGDPDGDGYSNLEEFANQTDPTRSS